MSNNLLSQQFPMSTQGQLATISEKMNPSVQIPILHHLPVAKTQMVPMGSGISVPTSELISSENMDVRRSHPTSSYQESHSQPMTNQSSGKIELQHHNVMVHSSFMPRSPAAGAGSVSVKMDTTQLPSKRKLPMEPMSNGSAAQILSAPNKRMVSVEHRPWLQLISEPNKGPMQMLTSSVSPRTQYLPALSKKTVQLESVSSNKSGKQTATRKQPVQKQPLPKPQNESSESVRSKMRESLAGALALELQQSEASKEVKRLQSQTTSTAGKNQEGYQRDEPASAASRVDVVASKGSVVTSTLGYECSGENGSIDQTISQETSFNSKTSDAKECDAQESQFVNPFPQDNVSYSDNVFSKDDLLQGNGLLWALDSDIEFRENSQTKMLEAAAAEDGNQGRTKEKSIQDPQLVAFKVEAELFKLFGGVNKKYKEKGRSLLFNLKDKNNPELREKVMYGEIPAERLCSMSAEELASKELAEWRQAKAEELAQMVVLQDTQMDIRRLVRKTHKGEFQVEVEPIDSGSVEVSVGSSSLTWSRSKNSQKKSPSITKTLGNRDEVNGSKEENGNWKDQGDSSALTVTLTSSEATGPMKGITVDDEMKDATGSLPPIVSLDEFIVSLDSERPFDSLSTDAGKETPVAVAEPSSTLKSPKQSPNGHVGTSLVNTDMGPLKPDSDVKTERTSVVIPKGERIWEGAFQPSVSSVISVIGIFRSGEKTSAVDWPILLEIKGRVRLDAFEKFLRELPNSRSRAVMVMCFVCKEESPKPEQQSLSEVAESYVSDGRVGFAEPAAGVELYLCPTHGKSSDILSKIVPRNQLDFLKSLDNGLIGVVVWRRPQLKQRSVVQSSSSNSLNNHREKGSSSRIASFGMSHSENHRDDGDDDDDDDDDDVPPGFGPGAVAMAMAMAHDDDDLPEFNFSSGGHVMAHSHSVDQVRALIHKYGKSKPSWNRDNDDDENDIPEWQPQAETRPLPRTAVHRGLGYQSKTASQVYGGPMARPATVSQPEPSGWWAHHQSSGREI